MGKENFNYTNTRYCYTEIKIENRNSCYKDNLRVRLYDKEEKIIAEDCLRLEYPEKYDEDGRYSEEFLKRKNYTPPGALQRSLWTAEEGILEGRAILAYVPYDKNSYKIRIVRLEGKNEVILESFGGGYHIKKSELIELYYAAPASAYRGYGYDYNEESQCHISPGPM